jgi:hypothetical protein
MAEKGAVGAVNSRSRVREANLPASPIEGALGLSAGALAQPDFLAMGAYNATETVADEQTAEMVYRRVFGSGMDGAQLAYLGLPATQQLNEVKAPGVVLGSLGGAVREANGLTAAVGNSDVGAIPGGDRRVFRPAAVVASDLRGLIRFGDVSTDLLKPTPTAPYGVSTDMARFEREYKSAENYARGHRGPSLVVLDAGDLVRARYFADQVTPELQREQWSAALTSLDAVVGMAEKNRGDDGVVIVLSQGLYSSVQGVPGGLGPVIVSGKGWSGYLASPSTHRTGVVTHADVTATALQAMGIKPPVAVLGDAMVPVSVPDSLAARQAHVARVSEAAVAIDSPKSGVLNVFIGLIVLVLGGAAAVIGWSGAWRSPVRRSATRTLQALLLLTLAIPPASWLMFLITPLPRTPELAVLSLLGTVILVWILALFAWLRLPFRVPVAGLALGFSLLMLVDQIVGAPLSAVGFLSYSPLLGARFYGMGNEAAGLFFSSSLIGAALLLDQWPDTRFGVSGRRWGVAVLGVVVVGVAAAPFLGANVGSAVWALAGFACAWMLMNGRRLGVGSVLAIAGLVVLAIGAFSAIDLLGGGQQTHLGRALASTGQGGVSQLTTIITRKAATNVRVLTSTNWSWILAAALAFLGFARFRRSSGFSQFAAENPSFLAAIVAALVAGALALFTEDSGIVIPSLIMVYVSTGLAWLMLARPYNSDQEESS